MPVPLLKFQQLLIESEILDANSARQFLNHLQAGRDILTTNEYATALVKGGKLTPYQARAIYQGRGKYLTLGNYQILDKIGSGGMGRIYRAKHRRMDRVVALKILPPELTSQQEAILRFRRELKAAARLTHPNIVLAYDADVANGLHFLVMEYVEGIDLSCLIKQFGTISVERAVNYISQAAQGIHYAHLQKVIHRDIKPGNLILDQFENIKILDMGLARVNDSIRSSSSINLTKTNVVMGTVDFMSPEQALNSKYVDERGDIYSLGMTLYYLLVGQPAYAGETAVERLLAHRDKPLPSLMDKRTDVDSRLDSIFQKMIAKKPEDRYQSMTEVIDAFAFFHFGTSAEPIIINESLDETEKIDAFLVGLETVPTFLPRVKQEQHFSSSSSPSAEEDGENSKKLIGFELTDDQQSILKRGSIESMESGEPGVPELSNNVKLYALLGGLLLLIIAVLLFRQQ